MDPREEKVHVLPDLSDVEPFRQVKCHLSHEDCKGPIKLPAPTSKFHSYYWAMAHLLGWPSGLPCVCAHCFNTVDNGACRLAGAGNQGWCGSSCSLDTAGRIGMIFLIDLAIAQPFRL